MDSINLRARDEAFIRQVEEESGQNVSTCYQCGNCTAGCPCGPVYDLQVNQIMRAIQLGDKKTVLEAASPWLCVSCSTCSARCPNDIDVARVMDTVRHIGRREGKTKYVINAFWDSFLQTVRFCGRSYELGIMALFMLRTGRFYTDLDLAPRMLPKKKMPYVPHLIRGKAAVGRIFKRFNDMQQYDD
ncbi:MAG TPA: 4Fe-4S dicluster domain-containing protein [Candidatus Avidesulfovibrio excrementigallinarum]|nr:4Fe-4S dicluster domain-containing protein [Candidatus Avidesulfovibrio excrementigallinarum]